MMAERTTVAQVSPPPGAEVEIPPAMAESHAQSSAIATGLRETATEIATLTGAFDTDEGWEVPLFRRWVSQLLEVADWLDSKREMNHTQSVPGR